MLHAGVLKKFGLYGLIRIALPLMPQAAAHWVNIIAWLCLGNIVYCGLVAMRQKNFNWLIGYSSVAHMGFVFLGIASLNLIGVTGAVLVMIAHGFLAALSFGLSGYLRPADRHAGHGATGRIAAPAAVYGRGADHGDVCRMRGAGLRQFCGGNHGVLRRVEKAFHLVTGLAVWGALVIGAVYMTAGDPEYFPRAAAGQMDGGGGGSTWPLRKVPYLVLLVSLLVFGFFPRLLTDKIKPSAGENCGHGDGPRGRTWLAMKRCPSWRRSGNTK